MVEINWGVDGEPPATWYPSYAWRDPRWFEFDRETLSDLRLRAADARQGMPLPPYKFIVHLPHLRTGLPVRSGLVQAVQAAKDPADLERAQTLPQSDTAPLAKAIASATFKARGLGDGED